MVFFICIFSRKISGKERAGAPISKETAEKRVRSGDPTATLTPYQTAAIMDATYVVKGFVGKPKGMRQIAFESGHYYVDGGWADSTPFENVSKSRRMNATQLKVALDALLISTRKRARFTSYSTTKATDLC